jgi:hypothetical protein
VRAIGAGQRENTNILYHEKMQHSTTQNRFRKMSEKKICQPSPPDAQDFVENREHIFFLSSL